MQSTGQGAGRHRTCPQQTVSRYRSRISGPLLQRFDLQIDEPAAPFEQLSDTRRGNFVEIGSGLVDGEK